MLGSQEPSGTLEIFNDHQIKRLTHAYNQRAIAYSESKDTFEAVQAYQTAINIYSKIKSLSYTLAFCYERIATIFNSQDADQDTTQAIYYYKKALQMYIDLTATSDYQNQTETLYDRIFNCLLELSIIYHQESASYEGTLGTPYNYEICVLTDEDLKQELKPDTIYLEKKNDDIFYWVLKNKFPFCGNLNNAIPIPCPFTAANLNFYKNEILAFTSKAGDTRVYDQIDAEYAEKMKKKAVYYNVKIIYNFILEFGISSTIVARCCAQLGNRFRVLKQDNYAEFFLENAACLDHIRKIIENAPPDIYIANFNKCKSSINEPASDSERLAFDAKILATFISENAEMNNETARCCSGIGSLYHFIEESEIATTFFNIARHIAMFANKKISFLPDREAKIIIMPTEYVDDESKESKATTTTSAPQNKLTPPIQTTLQQKFKKMETETKITHPLFYGHTLLFKTKPNNICYASLNKEAVTGDFCKQLQAIFSPTQSRSKG